MSALPTLWRKCFSGKEAEHRQSESFHSTAATVTHNWCVACVIVALLFFQIILVVLSILLRSLCSLLLCCDIQGKLWFTRWGSLRITFLQPPLWDMIATMLLMHLADPNMSCKCTHPFIPMKCTGVFFGISYNSQFYLLPLRIVFKWIKWPRGLWKAIR